MTTRPVQVRVSQGYAAHGIFGQAGVEDGIGDLIGDLVRMALGDRLTGKQKTVAFRQE